MLLGCGRERVVLARRTVAGAPDCQNRLRRGSPPIVAVDSLWEIATLHSLGRIRLAPPPREWLEKAVAPPLVRRHGISPAIAAEVATLPDSFHRDPADRILVATARIMGATLLTHDRHIVDSGLVRTLN
ncbi:MAG: type II toxin-antitoxin system VapC family toxin [Gemmatimonadota bacterium]|nr:type II toxin-antitoxin system VapC family toxin [Gemmatimonadota bacterium]